MLNLEDYLDSLTCSVTQDNTVVFRVKEACCKSVMHLVGTGKMRKSGQVFIQVKEQDEAVLLYLSTLNYCSSKRKMIQNVRQSTKKDQKQEENRKDQKGRNRTFLCYHIFNISKMTLPFNGTLFGSWGTLLSFSIKNRMMLSLLQQFSYCCFPTTTISVDGFLVRLAIIVHHEKQM